jgi:serine/threonine protein kinase/WD40 repeat protein
MTRIFSSLSSFPYLLWCPSALLFSPTTSSLSISLSCRLKKRISNDFGIDVTLKYDDREGDLITLASQNDLDVLLSEDVDPVHVIVTENLLPNVHGKRNSRVVPIWSGNSSHEWANTTSASAFTGTASAHSPSPTLSQLQPLRPIAKFDRFPLIEPQSSPRGGGGGGSGGPSEKPTRWKKAEILGKGAFGVVFLGLNTETGELMAIKQMTLDDISKKELYSLENEINMLRSLRHPNIVRYIGTEATPSTLSIFLEYVPGGSLKSLIDKFGRLEESVVRSYTRQLLLGLEYLHRNGIAHRDVKGANCLVGNDGAIKLADFGASKEWRPQVSVDQIDPNLLPNEGEGSGSGSHEVRGTPSWMAPEVIRNDVKHLNWKKADVWSLGCTTIEMTTGRSPWAQFTNPVTVLYHIACSDSLPEYPENPSVELLTFLNTCLQRDAANRPDITSLLLHPFVASATHLNPMGGGHSSYRPSTVSTTPSMSEWERDSLLSATWKTSTTRLGNVGRGETQSFIPDRDPVPNIPPLHASTSSSSISGIKHSPRFGHDHHTGPGAAGGTKTSPRYQHEIHPPVGNPDLDLEATAPRNVVENALRACTRDSSLSPLTAADKFPAQDSHSLENSLEASDLEDSSNTFESSRILTQQSSDDETTVRSSNSHHKISTAAARRRGRNPNPSSTGHSHQEDEIPRIPEGPSSKRQQQPQIPRLLSTKDESLYAAESLVPKNGHSIAAESRSHEKKGGGRDKETNKTKSRRPKVEKLAPMITPSTIRSEECSTPPRRTASVVSIGSPNTDSPKASSRKAIPHSKNLLEVLEGESSSTVSSKISRRPYEYTPTLSNNEVSISSSSKEANKSRKSTPQASEPKSDSLMKSWRSEKSGSVQIEDEIENQKELSERFFAPHRTDEIHDESEVYEDIHTSFSEDDLPAAELSDDCEVLENSLTHLSDDDVVDFTPEDYLGATMPITSDDWVIGQETSGGKSVLEMSVLDEERMILPRKDVATPPALNRNLEQWAGNSGKKKKQSEAATNSGGPTSLTISPSMPALEGTGVKLQGYAVVGHSLGPQSLGTPKTDIRINKQSGPLSKTNSSKLLHRGGGTVGNPTFRRNLEISGGSIDVRLSGANTANSLSRKLRDSLDVGEMQSGGGSQYYLQGEEDIQAEDSLNSISPILSSTAEILDEHTAGVSKLRLHPSKRLIFSASFDGTIRIWSSASTAVPSTAGSESDPQSRSSKVVLDVAVFAKASATNSGGLITRKPSGNKNAVATPTRPIRTTGLWVDQSCDTVWGGYSDGIVRVWVSDGRPMRALKGHDDLVTCVEGCETNVSSALGSPHVTSTGSLDKTVRVWDIRAKRAQVALFKGHNDSILSMKWVEGGRALVTSSKDRSIKIWDFRSGRSVSLSLSLSLTFSLYLCLRLRLSLDKHFGSVNVIKALPNQSGPQFQDTGLPSFVSGARDGMISSWASDGNCLGSQGAHRNSVNCMSEFQSLDNNSERAVTENPNFITAGADQLVKIWDTKRLKLLSEFTAANVVKVAWFHSSVVVGTSTGQMTIWEVNTSGGATSSEQSAVSPWTGRELTAHSQMCTDIVSDRHCVISSSKSGQIYRWSAH